MEKMKFMYNGIKVGKKLHKAHYSRFAPIGGTEEVIKVYARSYVDGLPKELGSIENNTEIMTDYHETDSFKITKESPYWNDAVEAMEKVKAHNLKTRKMYKVVA